MADDIYLQFSLLLMIISVAALDFIVIGMAALKGKSLCSLLDFTLQH